MAWRRPVASFTKEVNSRLAKPPLLFKGRSANRGLTSLVKGATVDKPLSVIMWTNNGKLLIRTSGTNLSEILSEMYTFSFKKMHLKISSAKWRQFVLALYLHKTHLLQCW